MEHLLKSICELAADIDGIERRYVKKGQRLLFCGPDLMALVSKCAEIRVAFDAFQGELRFLMMFSLWSEFWIFFVSQNIEIRDGDCNEF